MRRFLLAALAAFTALLGWGWWHAYTHASVSVAVNDVALKTPRQAWGQLKSAELVLRDAAGAVLAHARLTEPYGLVEFTDAAAGDCGRFEHQAPFDAAARAGWQSCYASLSRWQAGWAGDVATADVAAGGCKIDKVPVRVRRYDDWWLWWVPLPHVGGTPYSVFSFEIRIDGARCAAARAGPPQAVDAPLGADAAGVVGAG